MSSFNSGLSLLMVEGGWQLVNKFSYTSSMLGRDVVVPSGYFTDLASVPKPLRFIIPVANAKNRPAAVVHDYLCTHGVKEGIIKNQKEADLVFREALQAAGLGMFKRNAMYFPVRFYQFFAKDLWE